MLEVWLPFAILGGFVALLAAVTILRVRHAVARVDWAVEFMDAPTRRVGALALIPGTAVAAAAIISDFAPPHGVGLGLVSAFGAHVALLGAFAMEGVLLERDSEACARLEAGAPPRSSRRGRIVALLVGVAIVGLGTTPLLL